MIKKSLSNKIRFNQYLKKIPVPHGRRMKVTATSIKVNKLKIQLFLDPGQIQERKDTGQTTAFMTGEAERQKNTRAETQTENAAGKSAWVGKHET